MEEQLVSFETAKLAKEKGFDVNTNLMYATTEQIEPYNGVRWELYGDYYMAPSQSILARWFREKHKIDIWVEPFIDEEDGISSLYVGFWGDQENDVEEEIPEEEYKKTFEEAFESVLIEALQQIK